MAGAVLLASLTSCIFSPKRDDGGGGGDGLPEYPKLTNPYFVLDALEKAYEARDSVEIALIYDDSYIGSSFDPTTLAQIQLSKSDEVTHVHALHDAIGVTSVQLNYPPQRTLYTDLGDPPGWATIQVSGAGLGILIDDNAKQITYRLIGSGGTFEFKFIPTPPDSASPDTTWKIVRWTEYP